jgi:hypothetical protein
MPVGPYHRQETNLQTPAVALLQVASREVWGRTPRLGGSEPTVQAYRGPIGANVRGIEFTTEVIPYPDYSPIEARWYPSFTAGVELRDVNGVDYAVISATIKNCQP